MEAILLGIYAFFVWLIFIKFKWLPWNTKSQVIVVIIPIVGITVLILALNVVAPSTADVRVIKYTVQVLPQVRGKVIEVPVQGNDYVKKGDVLFRIDPTPYALTVKTLEAQLANAEGAGRQLREQLNSATANKQAVSARVELARQRVKQYEELAQTGAGDAFALQQAQADLKDLQSQYMSTVAAEAQVRERLLAQVDGDLAEVAQIKAQLENARWELDQTTTYAPANGWVINLQLRPGSMAVPLPAFVAMTFVEDEYQVIATFAQNELHKVKPGNEAEIALPTLPGEIIKAKVDSIVWAQGQGQMAPSGQIPTMLAAHIPPGRFAVKLDVDDKYRDVFLAAGAVGNGAIYTDSAAAIHILRKVFLRISSKLNYIIAKLH
ncbi:MAG: HlyD family secretion protein [Steroidobacteraceae bacterium]|jgi:multidrug resistance efflux pump|nr:HlyD family secretion protein [Steroidobacteraceae bacterium]